MEFSVIPQKIQMERFIPVENVRKKGNTFRSISFFSLLPEFQEISVPFVLTYNCQGPHGSTSENAQDRSGRWRQIYKRLSIQCESFLIGSVGGRFRTQL